MTSLSRMYSLSLEAISKLSLERLDRYITNDEYRSYVHKYPGEHYRLLAYLSMQRSGMLIFEIGTLFGYSALALAFNEENRVVSYNLQDELMLAHQDELKNIEFAIGDVCVDPRFLKADTILVDAAHDGSTEHRILTHLMDKNYRGLLIMDDIHLNPAMELVWEGIPYPKEDVTEFGHATGTGFVLFV